MGIELRAGAALPNNAMFGLKFDPEKMNHRLQEAFKLALNDDLLRQTIEVTKLEDGFQVILHPAAGPIHFEMNKERLLICDAKTSTVGPGYHAFLIDWLDGIGRHLKCSWIWEDEELGFYDESEYATHRDFKKLQQVMFHFLRTIAGIVSKEARGSSSLNLPMAGYHIPKSHIACPLGYLPLKYMEKVYQASKEEMDLARAFFPWWDQGLGAEFWKQFGACLTWTDVRWHVPTNPEEQFPILCAIAAFKRARQLGGEILKTTLGELEKLRDGHEIATVDEVPEGPGFMRFPFKYSLGSEMELLLPGWYHETTDDGTCLVWFGERTIRMRLFELNPEQHYLDENTAQSQDLHLSSHDEFKRMYAKLDYCDWENPKYWALAGEVASTNYVLMLIVCFEKKDDLAWAESIFQSVSLTKKGSKLP